MKKLACLFSVIFIVACVARPEVPEEPPEPATAFEGTWEEMRNQNKPVRGKIWTFRDNTVAIEDKENETTYSGTFDYNEEADPKELDLYFAGYPVNEAIYRLSGNMLMIKILETARTRSNKLRLERGYILIMLHKEREKPKNDQ